MNIFFSFIIMIFGVYFVCVHLVENLELFYFLYICFLFHVKVWFLYYVITNIYCTVNKKAYITYHQKSKESKCVKLGYTVSFLDQSWTKEPWCCGKHLHVNLSKSRRTLRSQHHALTRSHKENDSAIWCQTQRRYIIRLAAVSEAENTFPHARIPNTVSCFTVFSLHTVHNIPTEPEPRE